MLVLLIPIAWLLVVTVLLAVCRSAGRAEAPGLAARETPPEVIRDGLVAWDPVAARALRAHYARRDVRGRGRELSGGHAPARGRRIGAHDLRQAG
jgi:hypothetical protein